MHIALFIAFVWAVACLLFDAINTNKGLRAGVAVEGNPIIVAIAGNKPKLWQLLSIDGTIRVAMLGVGFIHGSAQYPLAFTALMLGGLICYGFKNIQGGRQWQWLAKNPGKKLPWLNTLWEKIIGFWG